MSFVFFVVFFLIVQNAALIIPQFTISVKFFSAPLSFSIFSLQLSSIHRDAKRMDNYRNLFFHVGETSRSRCERCPRRRALLVSMFRSYRDKDVPPTGRRRALPVSMQAMFPVGETSRSRCGSYRDKDVPPTGRHRAHRCSSGAPAPERVRSRRARTTGVTRSASKMHGEEQVFPPPYGKGRRFFHRIAEACHRAVA